MENGYAEITGRIKDIIIRGAEKIEPKEIEEVLSKHPEIIDVQVCSGFILTKMFFIDIIIIMGIIIFLRCME